MPISPDHTAPPASTPSKKGRYHAHSTAGVARWQVPGARAHRPPLPVLRHALAALARSSVSAPQCPVFWCGTCLRPVCLEPPAVPEVQYA